MVSNKWDSSYAVQVYTVHYVQCKPDIVALEVKNWCRKVFLPHFAFCALVECFLVYSSDTLTLPFTEIWFDSRRNWVPMGGHTWEPMDPEGARGEGKLVNTWAEEIC